MHNIIRIIY